MAFKVILLAATLALANAGILAPAAYAPGPAIAYSAAPAVSHISYSSPIVSYGAPLTAQTPAITSQSSNILRSFGNLGQVSTYSKTIDTPFSSVSKSDVRVSNPGLRIATAPIGYAATAPLGYAAPAYQASYAAPAIQASYAAPAIQASYAAPAIQASYAAPAIQASYAAPAIAAPAAIGVAYSAAPAVSHVTYQGLGAAYGW